jgi:hypothetical protein
MKLFKILSISLVVFLSTISISKAQNADTLLWAMDMLMSAPLDKEARVEIILENKSGKLKVREASMLQKGADKKLYRYTKPEKQAGIATLSLPDDIMWLYMPAFGKPTKISLLAKSQAFTGTDFSYEDMESKFYSERYTPSLIEDDSEYFLLKLIPKSKKSKYSHINLYLHKTEFYAIKMHYFDKRGNKIKVATYKYTKSGKYWYANEIIMTDLKKEHSTKILMNDVKFDQGVKDEAFSVEQLMPEKEETKDSQ